VRERERERERERVGERERDSCLYASKMKCARKRKQHKETYAGRCTPLHN
jgi:hypothetical protein